MSNEEDLDKTLQSTVSKMSDFMVPKITYPNLDSLKLPEITNPYLASEFCERLLNMINDFDQKLDKEHEVGMSLVTFGQAITFHVSDLGYYNPSLIRFFGFLDNGSPVELIQHVSQISFLLMKVKRLKPEQPKKRIGFSKNEE